MTHCVLIEWIDAASSSDWFSSKEKDQWIEERTNDITKTVGFIVQETRNFIVLTSGFTISGNYDGLIFIPKRWTIKITKVNFDE